MLTIIVIVLMLILTNVFVFGILLGQIITYKHVEELNQKYKVKESK